MEPEDPTWQEQRNEQISAMAETIYAELVEDHDRCMQIAKDNDVFNTIMEYFYLADQKIAKCRFGSKDKEAILLDLGLKVWAEMKDPIIEMSEAMARDELNIS